jgi:hypothetical protein
METRTCDDCNVTTPTPIDTLLDQVATQLAAEAKAITPSGADEEKKRQERKMTVLTDLAVEVTDIRGRYRAVT